MFNTSCPSFIKHNMLIATITSVSVLLLSTYTLLLGNCFWTENEKMTTFFARVCAQRGASRIRDNVRVCHSFDGVTVQLQL